MPALAAGAYGAVTITTAVSVTAAAATGGTSPYTYKWFLSTVPGALGTQIGGQTTLTLADTALPDNVISYITLQATDTAAATALGLQITVDPMLGSVAAGGATVSIGKFAAVSGGTLTHRQSGHIIKYYYDVASIPSLSNAVGVKIHGIEPVSGMTFSAGVTTGTDTHGAYVQYVTTGFDMQVAGNWEFCVTATYQYGAISTTPYVSAAVA